MLDTAKLRAVMPHMPQTRAELWLPPLVAATAEFKINTPDRLAAFLAQIAHESAELSRVIESLNYSASGLRRTWPKRFPSDKIAASYARQPQKIANFVYANRMGNGPPSSGDGWRYRGRGPIQNTGKDAYVRLSKALCLPLVEQPELLEQPGPGARAAGWFWLSRGLNQMADVLPGQTAADSLVDFKVITQSINGGLNGLADRLEFWERAKRAFS